LPYNPLGLAMFARLGRPTPDLPPGFPKPEQEQRLVEMFQAIIASAGSLRGAVMLSCD
jgi:hypothetical protein